MKYINGVLLVDENETHFFENGDEFSLHLCEDGKLYLEPYASVSLCLSGLSNDMLGTLLEQCTTKTLSEVIRNILEEQIKREEDKEKTQENHLENLKKSNPSKKTQHFYKAIKNPYAPK
jgi:hypothetical protein